MVAISTLSACGLVNAQRFDFPKGDPLSFLEFLQQTRWRSSYVVDEPISQWVKREHLPALIRLLNSKLPCRAVVLTASSKMINGSTIGDEAAFLIQGFRAGAYPPALNSRPLDGEKLEEILNWWEAYRRAW